MTTVPTPDGAAVHPDVPPEVPAGVALTDANHGAVPVRGVTQVPRSSTETGRFGRLFRHLAPLNLDDAQVGAVVAAMVDAGEPTAPGGGWGGAPTPNDSTLAAGWTYFGQFLDHDITFDPVSMLDRANDPDALQNFRTPRFDLDSVYGLGPIANPWLYDRDNPKKLLVGVNPAGFTTRDLSRNRQGTALIGDPRNDVHVIVSQLHLAFIDFHNRIVDRVTDQPDLVTGVPATPVGGWGGGGAATATGEPSFEQIVTLVRWHYQWLVLKQFLPLIVGEATAGQVLTTKNGRLKWDLKLYSVNRKPWMPVEFSGAAYRFGHTLVRDGYVLNSTLSPLPVFSGEGDTSPLADLRGHRPLPEAWAIEWNRFFDGLPGSSAELTQRARRFDTGLSHSLHLLPPTIDPMRRSLALLNLKRGVALGLPSGEDVAAVVASEIGLDPAAAQVNTGLAHPAPLWFWLLREAETHGGNTLGPVGGRIVAEVLVGLAVNDKSSFLKARPDWTPTLGTQPGEFTIADVLAP